MTAISSGKGRATSALSSRTPARTGEMEVEAVVEVEAAIREAVGPTVAGKVHASIPKSGTAYATRNRAVCLAIRKTGPTRIT
jgi:hypothetical protein